VIIFVKKLLTQDKLKVMKKEIFVFVMVFFSSALFAQQDMAYVDNQFVDRNGIPVTGEYKITYAPNEVSADVRLVGGVMNGPAVYFYSNGDIKEVANYANGLKNGEVVRYAENGNILMQTHYRDGQKDGVWKFWDINGNLRMKISYTNGKKSGVWKQWDERGILIEKKRF
jgi:hypothetical protein